MSDSWRKYSSKGVCWYIEGEVDSWEKLGGKWIAWRRGFSGGTGGRKKLYMLFITVVIFMGLGGGKRWEVLKSLYWGGKPQRGAACLGIHEWVWAWISIHGHTQPKRYFQWWMSIFMQNINIITQHLPEILLIKKSCDCLEKTTKPFNSVCNAINFHFRLFSANLDFRKT